jgi:hypothetical protein
MSSEEIRTSVQGSGYYDPSKDEFYQSQTRLTDKYSQFTHRYERIKVEELPPVLMQDFNHLVKTLKGTVLFSRQATDYETLKPISAIFCKTFKITINEKAKHSWLSIVSIKGKRDIVYHSLREGTTQLISLNEVVIKSKSGDVPLFEVEFGKECRLRDESAVREILKKEGTLSQVFTEEADGSLSFMAYFAKM